MAIDIDQAIRRPYVLLTGASSQIGVFLIPRLLRAGCRVIAVSRKGRPGTFPASDEVKWLNVSDALEAAEKCQYLISAGPLDLALTFLSSGRQFQKAIAFSSSSVETKQGSGNHKERNQIEAMLAMESELETIAKDHDTSLVIFRPTLIYGCGMDTNISRLAAWIKRFGFMPVNGKAEGLRQPVHADDLAKVAVTALQSVDELPLVMHLCGGDTLSYTDMVCKIFNVFGKPVRLLHMPQWFFILLVKIAGVFRPGSGINTQMVRRQRLDLVFDDHQARQLLDFNPRPFAPLARDFSLPGIELKQIGASSG